jgi:hypothetical protein
VPHGLGFDTVSYAVLPGSGSVAGVPIPGWATALIAVACAASAVVVLLVFLRNRRR